MEVKKIESAALRLNLKSRARLAGLLLDSLDNLSQDERDALWLEEAVRRKRAVDAGLLKTVPLSRVIRKIRRRVA